MREYKFRAWEKHAKRIAEVTTFKRQSGHLYHQIYTRAIVNEKMIDEWYSYDFGSNTNGIILMQYTGIKDKNGREIYEGDIVNYTVKGDNIKKIAVIKFNEEHGAFLFGVYKGVNMPCGKKTRMNEYTRKSVTDVEVIGNIYEDAELLKESEDESTTTNGKIR